MGRISPMFPVHSVYDIPVAAAQPWGLPCSVTSFVPVLLICLMRLFLHIRFFSLLAPVHLVSALHVPLFQVELFSYPDHAATAYILNDLWVGFLIGSEAL